MTATSLVADDTRATARVGSGGAIAPVGRAPPPGSDAKHGAFGDQRRDGVDAGLSTSAASMAPAATTPATAGLLFAWSRAVGRGLDPRALGIVGFGGLDRGALRRNPRQTGSRLARTAAAATAAAAASIALAVLRRGFAEI